MFGVGICLDGLLIETSAHDISSVFIKMIFGHFVSIRWSRSEPALTPVLPHLSARLQPAAISAFVSGKSKSAFVRVVYLV